MATLRSAAQSSVQEEIPVEHDRGSIQTANENGADQRDQRTSLRISMRLRSLNTAMTQVATSSAHVVPAGFASPSLMLPRTSGSARTSIQAVAVEFTPSIESFDRANIFTVWCEYRGSHTDAKLYGLPGIATESLAISSFDIKWLDSQFQNHVETLNLSAVQQGNANYRSLHSSTTGMGWGRLCAVDKDKDLRIDEDMELLEPYMEPFDPPPEMPTTLADVKAIKKCALNPVMNVLNQSTYISIVMFFAYIPISFWQQVVGETNSYAGLKKIKLAKPFLPNELMSFIGILFYMAVIDKCEYSYYWGELVEDTIFGGNAVGLDKVM
ncbi:unnamed protein product [Phytophthora fragariaefolia]|uniref:Unnamed protein product n=1 Tax=Phytophthora fragariaefolia TaxID=1490495 RepID=A0A9W6TVH1_9STRA|nr:unnamed protein product [Phytophthora fragariaefolia]